MPHSSGAATRPACRVMPDPTHSGRARWSCDCGSALVFQPYMTQSDWARASDEFFTQHGAAGQLQGDRASTPLLR